MIRRFTTERDGLTIAGRVYGTVYENMPAVILCHGFMADSSMCAPYAKLIAELGYLCFTFDFCGGSLMNRSEGKTADMSVLTELQDLKAVLSYVRELPYVNRKRISLLGCSQGGFAAALCAAQMPEMIRSLTLLYPAFCIPSDARKGHMMFARFDPADIPEIIRCGPMRLGAGYVKDVIDMDPYREIHGYEGPVLYLHGTKDRIVNVSYARRAKDEYPSCVYREIEGAGHMFRGKYERQAKAYIRDFFIQLLIRDGGRS